jgi:hypothetical protein
VPANHAANLVNIAVARAVALLLLWCCGGLEWCVDWGTM